MEQLADIINDLATGGGYGIPGFKPGVRVAVTPMMLQNYLHSRNFIKIVNKKRVQESIRGSGREGDQSSNAPVEPKRGFYHSGNVDPTRKAATDEAQPTKID
jgi:hypothetical protein